MLFALVVVVVVVVVFFLQPFESRFLNANTIINLKMEKNTHNFFTSDFFVMMVV